MYLGIKLNFIFLFAYNYDDGYDCTTTAMFAGDVTVLITSEEQQTATDNFQLTTIDRIDTRPNDRRSKSTVKNWFT